MPPRRNLGRHDYELAGPILEQALSCVRWERADASSQDLRVLLRAAIHHHCATCGADAAAICAVVDYEIGRVAGPAHRAWKAVMLQRRCDRIAPAADDEALEGARQSAAETHGALAAALEGDAAAATAALDDRDEETAARGAAAAAALDDRDEETAARGAAAAAARDAGTALAARVAEHRAALERDEAAAHAETHDALAGDATAATAALDDRDDATDGGCLFGDGAIADAAMVAVTAACDDEDGGGGGGRGGGGDSGGGDGDGSCGASPINWRAIPPREVVPRQKQPSNQGRTKQLGRPCKERDGCGGRRGTA